MSPRERLESIAAKNGEINQPILTPHLEFRPIGDGQVLLVSETFNTLLHGQVYPDLLALLVGGCSTEEIVESLSTAHAKTEINAALTSMAAKGYIVSGEYEMDQGNAAFWSSLGVPPCQVEEKLRSVAVAIHGDDDNRLKTSLKTKGISVSSKQAALSIYLSNDYLDSRQHAVNRQHLDSGLPWLLIQPQGMHPLFGPVFEPADEGPCWACLAYRIGNNNEVHSFVRNFFGEAAAFRPTAADPAALDVIYGIISIEIAKWLVLGDAAALGHQAFSLDVADMKCQHHPVMRRPQCEVCGDEALRNNNRPALPIRLQASPNNLSNSGGSRVIPPAQTHERYRHLISPVSGIVSWVTRTSPEADPWLHVHWAGSNLALRIRSLSSLRRSLRSKSAGKGNTAEQSEVSALCEAIERYSGAFHGDEIRSRKRYSEFSMDGDGQAIHPNDVQLFSDWQFAHADEINARGHPYNIIPPRFDPDLEVEWSPVWSFTENRHRYLPTAMLYGMTPEQRGNAGLWADSNGCAAGNTLEEAILQGFFELVERDAFALWWYNRISRPEVHLESFGDEYLACAQDYYRKYDRDLWVLDITSDLGIPTFVALSHRTDGNAQDIIYGAGTHTDPKIAVLRAVCEMNQCLTWVPRPGKESSGYGVDDPMCLWWWKNGKLEDHPFLTPSRVIEPLKFSDYAVPSTDDLYDEVKRCQELVENKGMHLLVLDQTRPDIGMPVVRVIVPGLRHFWPRFAPGRLFDVPVEMGWRQTAIEEQDLNPVPVIA